ncbi:MAG: septum formation protein Maf [Anaerolineaceae bacterium]|nr:septum formation protein Maf [Anaerolineaceae bacterium]HCU81491.1 septum formation protein Maf [Chloroflexota bacterium]|tara:strand:+ start:1032 stop:1700 length:669 start_codon:yes stop_codon:yes gene_type:complete
MLELDKNTQLVLASQSPRRFDLLKLFDHQFQVEPAHIDERKNNVESPHSFAKRLAISKTLKVAHSYLNDAIVIGADTIVVQDDNVVGKPDTNTKARSMLMQLQGKTHQVVTAIAIYFGNTGSTAQELCETNVKMRSMTEEEIEEYVSTGESLDKAGAYAIQNVEFRPATPLGGCLANVIGLPLCHMSRALYKNNISVDKNIAEKCQEHLGYDCPIYESILQS